MQRVSALHLRKIKSAFKWSMSLAYFDFSNLMPSLKRASYDGSTCKMTFHFLPSKVHEAAATKFGQMLMAGLNSLAFNQPIQQYELSGNTSTSFGPHLIYSSLYKYITQHLACRTASKNPTCTFSQWLVYEKIRRWCWKSGIQKAWGICVWMRDGGFQGPPESDSPRDWLICLWLIWMWSRFFSSSLLISQSHM